MCLLCSSADYLTGLVGSSDDFFQVRKSNANANTSDSDQNFL